ncbi:contractile injection system protein, VgrG/Pvc8 family [Paenibacillus elgii]
MVQQVIEATHRRLKIKAPYEIVALLDFKLVKQVGSHGEVYFKAVVSDDHQKKFEDLAQFDEKIEVFEKVDNQEPCCLFKGTVTEMEIRFSNGNYVMVVRGLSSSYQMDKKVRSRSFQNRNMTYAELIRKVIGKYTGSDFIDLSAGSKTLDEFTLQYEETDWQFLKRMASRFYTDVVADVTSEEPRFWFGISRKEVKGTLNRMNYTTGRHAAESGKAIVNGDWGKADEREFMYYEVESDQIFDIGDVVQFKNKALVINRVTASIKSQVLKYDYVLVPEAGLKRSRTFCPQLSGTSLEGKVSEVKDEKVRLDLKIDEGQTQEKDASCWFPYPTYYTSDNGIGWHCMPELGDTVSLYFPAREEKDAVVSHSLRKHTAGGDKINDPHTKRLGTKGKKEARFDKKETALASRENHFFIKLNEGTGAELYSKGTMLLTTGEDLVMYGKRVEITAAKELSVSSKASKIRMDGETHIKGTRVLTASIPDEEIKAYQSLQQEMSAGKNYPDWAQSLLLKYKADYYRAMAAGDEKGMKEVAEKAKHVRDKVDEIHAMPTWAQAQMNEYTEKWYEASQAGNKSVQDYCHAAANSLRDKVQMIALIRNSSPDSYKDANRLEELTQQYSDAQNKLTLDSTLAISKSADAIRAKYGVSHRAARENLNLLAKKFPNDFKYQLDVKDEWDFALKDALNDFAGKYGLTGKTYTRELLEAYVYQVANGILPWPNPHSSAGSPPTAKPSPQGGTPPAKPAPGSPAQPPKGPQPGPTPGNASDNGKYIVAKTKIDTYVKQKNYSGNQARAMYRINEYTDHGEIKKMLAKNSSAPLVFFFEGDGSYSYKQTDKNAKQTKHQNGRYGAMAIVVIDGEIKYTSVNASTLPDNGDLEDIATTKEGVYDFLGGYHGGKYPALRVRNGGKVPATYGKSKKEGTATYINVHMGYFSDSVEKPTSEGCLIVLKTEYEQFIKAVGVVKNSIKEEPTKLTGLVIVDRSDWK